MKINNLKKQPLVLIFLSCLLLLFVFIIVGTRLNRDVERQISDLFMREQVLQTVAIRNSFNENISRIINESHILASYSFPEFEEGLRSRTSMENLFQIELYSYQDSTSYSCLDFSGDKTIRGSRPDERGLLSLELVMQWEESYKEQITKNQELFIPPVTVRGDSAFLGLIFPVSTDGKLQGMLTTIIDLKESIDRYIKPIADDMSGTPVVLDRSLTILWDKDSRGLGRSLFEFIENDSDMDRETVRKLFELNDSGSSRLDSGNQFYRNASIKLSWSSFYIKEERIIIAMLSEEKEFLKILQNNDNLRRVLYTVIALFFVVASYGILRGKFLLMKQRFLEDDQERLSMQVDEKTNELQLLLNRYTALYESANDAIILMVDGVFVECNRKGLELFEADTPDQFIGKTPADFSPEYQEDGQASAVKSLKLLDDCRRGIPQIYDWKHRTLKGRLFHAEISLKSINMNEISITQAIVRDVSERIRSLKEKDLMMKEIHHRVKNNLQIINSFLHLQQDTLSGTEASAVIVDTQRRVDVMAKMHELLYSYENFSEIASDDYFREILNFFYTYQVISSDFELSYEFDDVLLDPDTCMYVGFILSELVDNALKHGPENLKTHVRVLFKTVGRAAVLEVMDNGPGFIPRKNFDYPGLGIKVIYALEAQLNGRMEWVAEKGTRAVFRFNMDKQ